MSKDNGRIVLYTEDVAENKDAVVPNVIGMSAEAANKALTDAGLNVCLKGTTIGSGTVVYSQSIPHGTVVAKGTIVEIEMRYMEMG
jgi:stage V sporulation protein D (sporulation-specific penicillin-binding protein)